MVAAVGSTLEVTEASLPAVCKRSRKSENVGSALMGFGVFTATSDPLNSSRNGTIAEVYMNCLSSGPLGLGVMPKGAVEPDTRGRATDAVIEIDL